VSRQSQGPAEPSFATSKVTEMAIVVMPRAGLLPYFLITSESTTVCSISRVKSIQNAGDAGTKAEAVFDIPSTEQKAAILNQSHKAESCLPPPKRRYARARSISQEGWFKRKEAIPNLTRSDSIMSIIYAIFWSSEAAKSCLR
jgi:hypothetical protein